MDAIIRQEYADDPVRLATDARAIRATILAVDDVALSQRPLEPAYEGEEGGVILAIHKRYERDRKLVGEKLEAAKAKGLLESHKP